MPLQLFGVGMGINVTVDRKISNSEAIPAAPAPAPVLSVPEQIGNISFWLKGDVGITKDVNNNVSVWADQSGNGNNALQNVATNQPTFGSDASGAFVGVGDNTSDTLSFGDVSLEGSTLMAIVKNVNGSAGSDYGSPIFCDITGGILNSYLQFGQNTKYVAVQVGTDRITDGRASILPISQVVVDYVITLSSTTNNIDLRVSNPYANLGVPLQYSTTTLVKMNTLARYGAINNFSITQIYEVIVFSTQLSTQQKSDMHNYFANKYGLGF